ncbi:Zn(II)2Cys6 transcription factor [Aspergillus udagawae]|uniref:Zn(2)-C6 fungal-type domain-containing protein n=1 Tax=Aspergillus udagawae TaxID=91492 RepID=A0A8E0QX74_9EURO|nr:uncharacterized protein Aud_009397 [Aspergillus udagawae]GIC92919.1 hypothetical protein Aud_009397 [Aspergillus udagawae]
MESEDAQSLEQSRFSDPAENVSSSLFSKESTEGLQSEEVSSSKVPIPRLAPPRTTGNRRIRTACAACREQKAKCSEHRPCLRCISFGITCTSLESKRESRERQIEELEQQVALYEELLQHLRSRVDTHDAELITKTLLGTSPITRPPSPDLVSTTHSTSTQPSFAVDYVEEDYHRNQQLHAFGYLGSHSEVSWIRDLRKEIDRATPSAESKAASPGNGSKALTSYFSRAQKLNFTNGQLFDHPNLQQVQAEGLSAFWLMSMGHINRAWRTCGLSVRSAIALGINLRSESKDTPNFSKELRYRVWWSIYTLENTLSIMTGRPTSAADTFCTTPLPIPYEEDQFHGPIASQLLSDYSVRYSYMQAFSSRRHKHPPSQVSTKPAPSVGHYLASTINEAAPSNSLYFLYFIDITMIMRRAIDVLYSPGGSREPWLKVGATIMDLVRDADAWSSSLPEVFQFRPMQKSRSFERQRWSLAFRFYSTKITISRPSLCRTDRLRPGQFQNPPLDQRKNAKVCVDSACDILDLLPDTPDVLWLIRLSPWWCIIHYLMQSATILLIELDFCVKFDVEEAAKITLLVEKAMGWLLAMAADNLAAQRAWEVCHSLYCCISLTPVDSMMATPSASTSPVPPQSNILRAMQDGLQLTQSHVSLPQNIVVHPTLQTMYDQFVPRESSGAISDNPGNTNYQ